VPDAPKTADGDRFRFRAGRPCLDLCSTLLWRHVAPTELLRTPQDLVRWITEAGLRPVPPSADARTLEDAVALREATYRLARAQLRGRRFARPDLATLNRLAAEPDAAPELRADGDVTWLAADPIRAALAAVARDAIALFAGPLAGRLRECAAEDCAFLFVDTSRAGARRWCATNRCGNRQRVRNHRRRRRDPR
jgi:predicted RNA-binding Zn ribbon-like protein